MSADNSTENEPHRIERVYAMRDDKLAQFHQPYLIPNNAVALRQFSDLVNDRNTEVSKHSEDFSIWYLALYDATDGVFLPDTPVCLARGSDFAKE